MELVKSNRGRKASGKGPYQKKQPQRGMGVAQLESLRIQERWKKMTETNATTTGASTTHFPSDQPNGTGQNVSMLPGLANYGFPMMINGGNGGLWGWGGETAGLMMQRVAGNNGGFVGLNGQFLVGAPGSFHVAGVAGVVEASKELSSMPKLQHSKPDHCNICVKKHCHGENAKFDGVNDQFCHVLPNKRTGFLGHMENNQNINEERNGFGVRAASNATTHAGSHMNIKETVEVLAIHRKGNSMGSGSVLMEYEFFPGKSSSRNTCFKEWEEFSAEASVAVVGGEVSYVNHSDCVDLSLKL